MYELHNCSMLKGILKYVTHPGIEWAIPIQS